VYNGLIIKKMIAHKRKGLKKIKNKKEKK